MNNINSEKIVEKIKSVSKNVVNTVKSTCKDIYEEACFINKSDHVKLIRNPVKGKMNKTLFVVLDEDKHIMYVKCEELFQNHKSIVENSLVQISTGKIYYIEKVDFENKYDYLFKINKGYKTIQCYKIYLKDAI